jgi:hypothetical protein
MSSIQFKAMTAYLRLTRRLSRPPKQFDVSRDRAYSES